MGACHSGDRKVFIVCIHRCSQCDVIILKCANVIRKYMSFSSGEAKVGFRRVGFHCVLSFSLKPSSLLSFVYCCVTASKWQIRNVNENEQQKNNFFIIWCLNCRWYRSDHRVPPISVRFVLFLHFSLLSSLPCMSFSVICEN